jgi:hypothetical protein
VSGIFLQLFGLEGGDEEMKQILQCNFKFKVPRSELEKAFMQTAQPIANVKGLQWKIWGVNEAEKSAAGIYLFKDDASLQAYLKGEIMAGMSNNPAVSNVEIKVLEVLPQPTKITHGPIE